MKQYILFLHEGKPQFCVPTGELSIEETARKDGPAGAPYLIVSEDQLPEGGLEYFAAWEVDFSKPDGHSIGAEAWFAEQKQKELQQLQLSGEAR